ncbi:hypothetical protein BCR34DRAFT_347249 [Clohesyomyces aquaticus]|uniref:Uncharacterized protein n=1 Tax=Clohesyomyces aquaticus TaxID=1231657 RepID=A0A1Y1ZJW5_9PLEO|nr:hypothetical protein BCR34DRAFT_347249 [Clohesyomyces aquaticus]
MHSGQALDASASATAATSPPTAHRIFALFDLWQFKQFILTRAHLLIEEKWTARVGLPRPPQSRSGHQHIAMLLFTCCFRPMVPDESSAARPVPSSTPSQPSEQKEKPQWRAPALLKATPRRSQFTTSFTVAIGVLLSDPTDAEFSAGA